MPCFYFGCTIAGLADPLLSSPNATMGDRGSGYKAAINIDKNIAEYFCRYLWLPISCPKIGFCNHHFTTDATRWVQGGRHGGESGLWDDGEREKSSMILLLAEWLIIGRLSLEENRREAVRRTIEWSWRRRWLCWTGARWSSGRLLAAESLSLQVVSWGWDGDGTEL